MYQILNGQLLNKKTEKPYLVFTPFKKFCMANFKVSKPNPFDSFIFEKSNPLLNVPTAFPY